MPAGHPAGLNYWHVPTRREEKALRKVEDGAGLALLAATLHSMHELVDLIQRRCRRSPGRIQFGCPEML